MKIRSKIDVITNSSTEVFTLKTEMSLAEVSAKLKEITSGYLEPEVMKSKTEDGVLRELIDFGYLIDTSDRDSLVGYQLGRIFKTEYYDDEFRRHDIPGATELRNGFLEYFWTNRGALRDFLKAKYTEDQWAYRTGNETLDEIESDGKEKFMQRAAWGQYYTLQSLDYYPLGFIESFLESWDGPRPKSLEVAPYRDADTYIGDIGFMGEDDNSIPYDTWDAIREAFGEGTRNWHMG